MILLAYSSADAQAAYFDSNNVARIDAAEFSKILKGEWDLISRTCIIGSDTIVQKTSHGARFSINTRPRMKLAFKSNGNLRVYSFPWIFGVRKKLDYIAEWKIETQIIGGVQQIFLRIRNTVPYQSGGCEFCGIIILLDKINLHLLDEEGCIFILKKE